MKWKIPAWCTEGICKAQSDHFHVVHKLCCVLSSGVRCPKDSAQPQLAAPHPTGLRIPPSQGLWVCKWWHPLIWKTPPYALWDLHVEALRALDGSTFFWIYTWSTSSGADFRKNGCLLPAWEGLALGKFSTLQIPPLQVCSGTCECTFCKWGDAGSRGLEPPAKAGLQRSSHRGLQRRWLVPTRAPVCRDVLNKCFKVATDSGFKVLWFGEAQSVCS